MRRREVARAGIPVLLAGVLTGLVAGCGSAVGVTPAPRADSAACRQASRHWPRTVGNMARTATTSHAPTVAAWGDPAVIARCGVTSPGPTTDQCVTVGSVDWVAHRLSDGVRFTTFGRDPAIEVLVPHDYAPEPLLLPAFAAAADELPEGSHHCVGLG